MAEDWAIDVRKYVPDADEAAIAGIVRHCGIALRSRDASLVSFLDPEEVAVVRESFCRKKLGLTDSDEDLNAAIARVGERMKADTTKNRVTVYYLLAEMFGKLGLFGGAAAAAAAPVAELPPAPPPEPLPAAAVPPEPAPLQPPAAAVPPAAPLAAAAVAAPAAAAAAPAAHPRQSRDDRGIGGTALWALGAMGLIVLATATLGSLIGQSVDAPAPVVAPAPAPVAAPPPAAPVAAAPAIPEGAGVVASEVEGRPQVSVYFDTAKADVTPDFATVAAPVKAYTDANPGDRLAVSGYNDPRGDPAFNAELSKNRAQNVAAALAALGIPGDRIDLEKPPETTDTTTSLENARRVDIMVRPGS
jgi:outer membrane protein OmpA-like peptidoglycan-associated protein